MSVPIPAMTTFENKILYIDNGIKMMQIYEIFVLRWNVRVWRRITIGELLRTMVVRGHGCLIVDGHTCISHVLSVNLYMVSELGYPPIKRGILDMF